MNTLTRIPPNDKSKSATRAPSNPVPDARRYREPLDLACYAVAASMLFVAALHAISGGLAR